jgi:hypothetical protein
VLARFAVTAVVAMPIIVPLQKYLAAKNIEKVLMVKASLQRYSKLQWTPTPAKCLAAIADGRFWNLE